MISKKRFLALSASALFILAACGNGGVEEATEDEYFEGVSDSQYIYNLSFEYTPNFGYASAVSYSIVLFVIVLSAIQFRVGREKK